MIRHRIGEETSGYMDMTRDRNTTDMAELVCLSLNTPPTYTTWLRNGKEIEINGDVYDSVKVVTDAFNSHYKNVLIVKQVIKIVGEQHFSCVLSNYAGNTSFDITTNISGIYTTF